MKGSLTNTEIHLKMEQFQHENSSKVTFTKHTRRPKLVVGLIVIIVLAVAVIVGLVVYFNTGNEASDTKQAKDKNSNNQAQVHNELIDCHPDKGASQDSCSKRGCIWAEQKMKGAPWCIYPESHGYLIDGDVMMTTRGQSARLHRIQTDTIYGGDIYEKLSVTVEYQTENSLRVKIVPNNVTRYEVPLEALNITASSTLPDVPLYDVTLIKGPPQFGIVVKRKGTNTTVFSTDLPGMTYSDQFLQITTRLPSDNLYGFGEHIHRRFRHDMNWKRWSIFTRDIGAVGPENLYGAHPVYMNLENDGKASVVLLKNSNAMEVVLQPSPNPAITYRVIGGILDFYIFMGPSPEQAVQQYIQAIGRPVMPPYWSLGYHLCRWGYKDLEDMKMVINRTRAAGIPYDVQWGDIEYMYKKYAFTYDRKDWSGLPEVVQDLHTNNMKFVVIVDPGIGADRTINIVCIQCTIINMSYVWF
ncbi:sucrase-isomaltase, intestinal [Patella vulgata]|uniref:sucrase-isomaltase, intestinal n=1 Tax=Patella vulgata TaxID=6465 RepID=UPI00217F912B|nr:sucrase-isomaltase, intestinal [Patella vulgata]